jgi:hypothetical protein
MSNNYLYFGSLCFNCQVYINLNRAICCHNPPPPSICVLITLHFLQQNVYLTASFSFLCMPVLIQFSVHILDINFLLALPTYLWIFKQYIYFVALIIFGQTVLYITHKRNALSTAVQGLMCYVNDMETHLH